MGSSTPSSSSTVNPCERVVKVLRGVDWSACGVTYVVLFGSAVRGCRYRDVDLAILFRRRFSIDVVLDIILEVVGRLGLSEDRVDNVVLNREDVPCTLIVKALGHGIPIYYVDRLTYIEDALRRLWVCWDFEISCRKLRLLEAAVESVRSKWGFRMLLEVIVGVTRRLDEELEKGYDPSSWGDQMKYLHALQIQSQALIDLVLRLSSLLGRSPLTLIDAGRFPQHSCPRVRFRGHGSR